jgi:hypothetical protein
MTTKDEALKLALWALEESQPEAYRHVITAIKEVLAQPEQEPVAWVYNRARYGPTDLRGQQWRPELSLLKPYEGNGMVRDVIPLYASPPAQRKPLTEELEALFTNIGHAISSGAWNVQKGSQTWEIIEQAKAAHGIKGEA